MHHANPSQQPRLIVAQLREGSGSPDWALTNALSKRKANRKSREDVCPKSHLTFPEFSEIPAQLYILPYSIKAWKAIAGPPLTTSDRAGLASFFSWLVRNAEKCVWYADCVMTYLAPNITLSINQVWIHTTSFKMCPLFTSVELQIYFNLLILDKGEVK